MLTKKYIDKKETTRKVHVRAKHCGVQGWRWHVCSKLDFPYYNTETSESMLSFLKFVALQLLFKYLRRKHLTFPVMLNVSAKTFTCKNP